MAAHLETHIAKFIAWYQENRAPFAMNAYLDESTFFRRLISADTDWGKAEVVEKETAFTRQALAKLNELFSSEDSVSLSESLSIVLLGLKNRTEYASSQSDFYPPFATLIIFTYACMTMLSGRVVAALAGLLTLIPILCVLRARWSTRRVVARTKEIINIIEMYRSQLTR